jgi:SAM-dependent methyltransferase
MTEQELQERMRHYQFYHTIQLTESVATAGWPKAQPIVNLTLRNLRPLDLRDKRVLDIGCRDGFFSFQAEKMGAAEVVAIDNDVSPGALELLIPFLRSRVRMHERNLYDLRPEQFGTFDLVVCPGVLYHLRYPVWGLKLIGDLLNDGGELLLETAVYVDDNRLPLILCPIGKQNPYYPDETSCTFFNVKGLTDTLTTLGLNVLHVDYKDNAHLRPWPRPGLRRRLRAVLAPEPPEEKPIRVDRALFHCRKTPALVNQYIAGYWDGTHSMHSGRPKGVPGVGSN